MKYESEIIAEILEKRGHEKSSLHYQSECIESWIEETKGAYPKLCDYESEWLNYINENPIGEFPYETITNVTEATINNVVPYAYKSATLKGSTKYRDIDTGEFLETFEDGRNLELVSVKMPVLTTTGKNLFKLKTPDDTAGWGNHNFSLLENGFSFQAKSGWNSVGFNVGYPNQQVTVSATVLCSAISSNKLPNQKIGIGNVRYVIENRVDFVLGEEKRINSTFNLGNTGTVWFYGSSDIENPDFKDEAVEWVIKDIQVELGSQFTSYEPFKSNILTVNEPIELRGIGDIKDELDLLTGEVAQRVGKTTITGDLVPSVFFSDHNNNSETMCFERFGIIPFQWNQIISADWPISHDAYNPSLTHEYFNPHGGYGIFRIKRSRLETEDVNGFKKWLNENPITIYHPVIGSEPVKTVDLTITNQDGERLSKLKPIEGTMNIQTNGSPIKPTVSMEIPTEAIAQNLASFIEEE